jgi:glucose/arabinose dehydrogenase
MKVKFFSKFLVAAASMIFGSSVVLAASGGMDVPTIKAKAVMTGLENPWDMAFSGGDMFYTEKCKGLSVRTKSGKTHALYGMKGSSGYADTGKDLFCEGQAGMLGVALDRDFASNRTLYLYSTSNKYHGSGCKTNFEKCDGNIVMKFKVAKN